jgi:hypothetical protein
MGTTNEQRLIVETGTGGIDHIGKQKRIVENLREPAGHVFELLYAEEEYFEHGSQLLSRSIEKKTVQTTR